MWSVGIRPTGPSSENIDALRHFKRFPLAVDWVAESQRGIKDKRAFVDYVSRLQQSRYWMPDPDAKVEMADERYIGVWLNGMEERQARWYLKEGIPCFVAREVGFHECAQLAALETRIDFAAGSDAASIHWSVNDYDAHAITRGDLTLEDTRNVRDPGWTWPIVHSNKGSVQTKSVAKEEINYDPPSPNSVVIAKDRVSWIKPPPVKKAEPSRPGAPPHERKKWRKFVESYDLEGTFEEVSTKKPLDHRSHSMYDRENRWQILFLRPPKAPLGCVSDVNVFGQPCPEGIYNDVNEKRRRRPYWIYYQMEPRTADVGREAPVPRPEELPLLRRSPHPEPDDDSDSDDDYYPRPNDVDLLRKDSERTQEELLQSATMPAAPIPELVPAATGAIVNSAINITRSDSSPIPSHVAPVEREKSEDEVSLGDEDSAGEAMGPQIPMILPIEAPEARTDETLTEDPLEFASPYLMIYGIPLTEGFASIQSLITSMASRLQLSVNRIFRTVVGQSQSFWLATGSTDQARQLRNYAHHRHENNVELLISFANYEDYVRALTHATHNWSSSTNPIPSQSISPRLPQPPIASSSDVQARGRGRRPSRDRRRTSPSPERRRPSRRSPVRPRYRSPPRSAYPRQRYYRSPSPYYRNRSPYRRSVSPMRRNVRSSRLPSPVQSSPSVRTDRVTPSRPIIGTAQVPPLPLVPNAPAVVSLPQDAPLPFGANLAFMWSPSGNTLSPVLIPGNATVLPYPMPPSAPIPSALLPWPVAATMPIIPMSVPNSMPAERGMDLAVDANATTSLASRITDRINPPPASPPAANSHPTLISRITSDLATRLSEPVSVAPLSSRLSDSLSIPLAERLEMNEQMEVEYPMVMNPMVIDDPHLAAISEMMSTAGPLVLDPMQYDYPRTSQDDQEDDDTDEPMEELGYKKTKRGRRSGQKIQGYRRRDKEREERRRRKQRRR